MKQLYRYILSISLSLYSVASLASTSTQNENTFYAKTLGWIAQKNTYNICNGYYRDFPIVYINNPLIQSQTNNFDIHADHFNYSFQGTSHLQGNIIVTQPQSRLSADKADLYRDPKTGKLNLIKASGNVSVYQPGTLLVAPTGTFHLDTQQIIMENAAYRHAVYTDQQPIAQTNAQHKTTELDRYDLNYWGHAKEVNQVKPKHFEFKHATYSTCPPVPGRTCAWQLHTAHLTLDKEKEVGKAYNSVLYLKKIPVFYTPYVSFPLDHARKSGFLSPSYTASSTYGYRFNLPYYWNIAPNYDDTFTPAYMTERGFMLSNLFRYLTPDSNGKTNIAFLPYDQKFHQFQKDSAQNTDYIVGKPEELKALENDSDSRYSIFWDNSTNFNSAWSSNINYSRVSDDYFIKDLGHNLLNNSDNQLLQQANLNYQSEHWQFGTLVQSYQTLHQIDMAPTSNQYQRLPQIQLNGLYPQAWHNFDFSMQSSSTYFNMSQNPDSSGSPKPILGNRFAINPSIDQQFTEPYGYLIPQLQMQANDYALHQTGPLPNQSDLAIPTFDLHGGLYFDRDFQLGQDAYKQTLEPELFYLYTPYVNQNKLPIFDTISPTFNYNYLFLTNRFSGVDRVGDANQVTYAVTSRLVDEYSGIEKGEVSIGQIYYFKNRQVQLCSGASCNSQVPTTSNTESFSPIASQATYNFTPNISTTGGVTWNTYGEEVSYGTLGANYTAPRHLLNLTYDYNKSDSKITGSPTTIPSTLQDINLSGEWFLMRHVDLLGRYSYTWSGNETNDHGNAYLAGLEYDSCCWAIRFIGARNFVGVNANNNNQFEDVYYIQFDLKGLGSIDNNDPSTFLSQSISGYQDTFDPEIL